MTVDRKKKMTYPIIFIVLILTISYSFSIFIFSSPETVGLFPLAMFIPGIIGLIINYAKYRSFKSILEPIITKINLKSIIFAVFYPLCFIVIVAISVFLLDFAEFNKNELSRLRLPSVEILILGTLLVFGEEYGWRGLLLKQLTEAKGKIFGTIVVGVVWAFWHAPFVFGLAIYSNTDNPVLLMILQMGAVFVFSMPFAYSYFLTNNIFPPMLLHFVWNFYNPIVLGNIYRNRPGIMVGNLLYINGEGLAGIILGSLFMIWFIVRVRKEKNNSSNNSLT